MLSQNQLQILLLTTSVLIHPLLLLIFHTSPTSDFDTLVDNWFWEFRDIDPVTSLRSLNGTSSAQNPMVVFSSEGEKEIQLTVESSLGCSNTFIDIITLGSQPSASFDFDNVCDADATQFSDQSITDIFTTIVSYTWDFGDGNIIGPSAPTDPVPGFPATTFQNPAHDYAGPGTRVVRLTITSDKGCMSTFAQPVSILENQTVTITSSYTADFEADEQSWAPNSDFDLFTGIGSPSSWVWSDLSGATNIQQMNQGNVFWTGGAPLGADSASFYTNENSWVDGPCFDLTGLARPMISLDHWVDTELQTDGAVIQYSVDKGITWVTIGTQDDGIDDPGVLWYNSSGIVSKPGDQIISQYGWSGVDTTTTWVNSRYSLDAIPVASRDEVRIRIAFSSNETNVTYFEGFAFDNVFIGEKERIVLLENFVNMTDLGVYDANIDEIDRIELAQPNDFVFINYHTETPSSDEFNLDNKIGPLARWGNYSISTHNKSFIDGNFKANVNTFNDLEPGNIDQRSLVDPVFDITIEDLSPVGVGDQLTIRTSITAKDTLNAGVIVHTAIIEKNVGDRAYNVFKKFLPNSDGILLNQNWIQNDTWNNTAVWDMSSENYVEVYNPDSLAVIAFVQRKTFPYEIYQTAYLDLARPYQGIDPITGTIDDLLKADAGTITMYPNPAKNQLTFAVPGQVSELLNFRIVDQRGVEMTKGAFRFDTGKHSIDIRDIPNGIYFVLIGTSDKPLVYHKLSIMRH